MLPGYNHNIDYRKQLFHVQTEDSGVTSPFITTQVFLGGTIINSLRTSYGDLLLNSPSPDVIKKRMQHQHKGSLKALLAGDFDRVIEERSPPEKSAAPLEPPRTTEEPKADDQQNPPKPSKADEQQNPPELPNPPETPKTDEQQNPPELPNPPETPKTDEQSKADHQPETTELPKADHQPETTEPPKADEQPKADDQPETTEAPKSAEAPRTPRPQGETPEPDAPTPTSSQTTFTPKIHTGVTEESLKEALKHFFPPVPSPDPVPGCPPEPPTV